MTAGSPIFLAAALTLGLLVSTIAKTQFQAFQLTFFTFLPQILLSGFMSPFDAMPRPAQVLAQALPLTHFLRVIRGIVLRGGDPGRGPTEPPALGRLHDHGAERRHHPLPEAPRLSDLSGTGTLSLGARTSRTCHCCACHGADGRHPFPDHADAPAHAVAS